MKKPAGLLDPQAFTSICIANFISFSQRGRHMTVNNMAKPASHLHTVQMDQRKQAMLTGVTDVCSFHETEIVLKVENSVMVITGEQLHIGKLLLEDGRLDIQGHIDGLIYEKPRLASRSLRFWRRKEK